MTPDYSIVVPVYNAERFIKTCLDCVLGQDYENWECICVDDGSTDSTGALLDDYARKDTRFLVVHQRNGGVAAARQMGVGIARGKYIGWVDADDRFLPGHFRELYEAIQSADADMAFCGVEHISSDGIVLRDCRFSGTALDMRDAILSIDYSSSLWGKFFRRATILRSGANFGAGKCAIMEDAYFLVKFLQIDTRLAYVNNYSYQHCNVNEASLSRGGREWWRLLIEANQAIYDLAKDFVDVGKLRIRMAKIKIWLLYDRNVTDEMFYGFFPDIRWLPDGLASLLGRIRFFLATLGLRKVVVR